MTTITLTDRQVAVLQGVVQQMLNTLPTEWEEFRGHIDELQEVVDPELAKLNKLYKTSIYPLD